MIFFGFLLLDFLVCAWEFLDSGVLLVYKILYDKLE